MPMEYSMTKGIRFLTKNPLTWFKFGNYGWQGNAHPAGHLILPYFSI
jgi:hypothetical protein